MRRRAVERAGLDGKQLRALVQVILGAGRAALAGAPSMGVVGVAGNAAAIGSARAAHGDQLRCGVPAQDEAGPWRYRCAAAGRRHRAAGPGRCRPCRVRLRALAARGRLARRIARCASPGLACIVLRREVGQPGLEAAFVQPVFGHPGHQPVQPARPVELFNCRPLSAVGTACVVAVSQPFAAGQRPCAEAAGSVVAGMQGHADRPAFVHRPPR